MRILYSTCSHDRLTHAFPCFTTARWLLVIRLVLTSLTTGITTTIRDVYYTDVSLFNRSQATVSRIIESLSTLLAVPRNALGIVASPRGLFSGRLRICFDSASGAPRNGPHGVASNGDDAWEMSDAGNHGVPSIIHDDSAIARIEALDDIGWILFVEKEATFKGLSEQMITKGIEGMLKPGIIYTVSLAAEA